MALLFFAPTVKHVWKFILHLTGVRIREGVRVRIRVGVRVRISVDLGLGVD